jgi:hypothetical protein
VNTQKTEETKLAIVEFCSFVFIEGAFCLAGA